MAPAPSMHTARAYAQHLSETDLRAIAPAAGLDPAAPDTPTVLRARPSLIEPALVDDELFATIFAPRSGHEERGAGGELDSEPFLGISPFLVFAVAVHRGVIDLHRTSFVEERIGQRRRVPVFGTDDLRELTIEPERRLFLVEHLASYTRVRSGPVFVKRGARMRRHRFSEIDPGRMAALIDVVPEQDRPGLYRRLGDLALFLTGVFPDATTRDAPHPVEVERLLRTLRSMPGIARLDADDIEAIIGMRGRAGLLEWLGPRWYRMAASSTPLPSLASMLGEIAERFDEARRFLTLITDRYLLATERWFGTTA